MASPTSPSAALLRTARSEIARIERAVARVEQRRAALLGQLAELDNEANDYAQRKRLLEELIDVEHAAPTAKARAGKQARPAKAAVKGAELRRVAARLLWSTQREREIHYREWFERVVSAGYAVGGKDPVASFLTNMRDSPAVSRGSAPGLYRLDPNSLDRIAQDIREVTAELADVEQSIERVGAGEQNAAEALREHRDELKHSLRRLQVSMSELRYVFQAEPAPGDERSAELETLQAA